MKTLTSLLAMELCCCGLWAAENVSGKDVIEAAQKLKQQENYSWISTSHSAPGTMDWRQGPTEGKTEKAGYAYVSFTLGDNTVSMGFKGTNAAINWADQWHRADELQNDYAWIGERLRTYKFPAEEAEFLAQNTAGWEEEKAGTLTGTLNAAALKWLLSRGRRTFAEIPDMKGSVRFRLENGALAKYEYTLQGKTAPGPDQDPVLVDRITVVEIQKVGSTQAAVPPEAREKLR